MNVKTNLDTGTDPQERFQFEALAFFPLLFQKQMHCRSKMEQTSTLVELETECLGEPEEN